MESPVSIRLVPLGFLIILLNIGAMAQEFCSREIRESCPLPSACLNYQCGTATSHGNTRFRNVMLEGHNALRRNSRYALNGADMYDLRWSRELEDNALRWIQSLCSRRAFHHESRNCRVTPSFDSVGQNLWSGTGQIYGNELTAAKRALSGWHKERSSISESMDFPSRGTNVMIGHETHLMWAKPHYVGCAYLRIYDRNHKIRAYIACNYAEAGNRFYEDRFDSGRYNTDSGRYNTDSVRYHTDSGRYQTSSCPNGGRMGRSGHCEYSDDAVFTSGIKRDRKG